MCFFKPYPGATAACHLQSDFDDFGFLLQNESQMLTFPVCFNWNFREASVVSVTRCLLWDREILGEPERHRNICCLSPPEWSRRKFELFMPLFWIRTLAHVFLTFE